MDFVIRLVVFLLNLFLFLSNFVQQQQQQQHRSIACCCLVFISKYRHSLRFTNRQWKTDSQKYPNSIDWSLYYLFRKSKKKREKNRLLLVRTAVKDATAAAEAAVNMQRPIGIIWRGLVDITTRHTTKEKKKNEFGGWLAGWLRPRREVKNWISDHQWEKEKTVTSRTITMQRWLRHPAGENEFKSLLILLL